MTSTENKANLSNWRESPHNHWAFVNVDKILRTDVIPKSDKSPSSLETSSRSFEDFRLQWKDTSLDLAGFIKQSSTDGLIIMQHGKILFEQYANGNTEHSKHIMMSMTKSVTGLIVGILQDQGKLNAHDLVTKYVPEVSGTVYKDITIRQCIDMRSGAKYPDSHEYRCAMGWNPELGGEKYTNLHDFVSHFDPETTDDRFEYVSINTDLIGWVIERATEKKYAEVVSELLWKPLDAENDALMSVDKNGSARAAGGMCATLRDIARIGQLVVEGGRGIVPSKWLEDIVHGGDKDAFARGAWAPMFPSSVQDIAYRSYCLGNSREDLVMMLGIHGQNVYADRKNGIVVAKTGSQAEAIDIGLMGMTSMAWREIQRMLT